MSICDNTTVNQETSLKLQSIRKTKTCRNACKKKLSMTLELDRVPRYFSTRYCPPLIFFKALNLKTSISLSLMIRNTSIEKVSSFKLSGTILDEHLSWKNHVILLKKKLHAILVAVMEIRSYLSKNALLITYHSLIMS